MSFPNMNTSLKINKRTRVSTFEKMENFKNVKKRRASFNNKTTPHQLKKIREKLQKENNKELKRNVLIFSIVVFIVIYVIGFVKI